MKTLVGRVCPLLWFGPQPSVPYFLGRLAGPLLFSALALMHVVIARESGHLDWTPWRSLPPFTWHDAPRSVGHAVGVASGFFLAYVAAVAAALGPRRHGSPALLLHSHSERKLERLALLMALGATIWFPWISLQLLAPNILGAMGFTRWIGYIGLTCEDMPPQRLACHAFTLVGWVALLLWLFECLWNHRILRLSRSNAVLAVHKTVGTEEL